jgi:hypothetical protein
MGEPTYETIAALKRCLQSNASSIKCTLGGGRHGYLALIVSDEMYATLSNNVPFVAPEIPPVEPEIPNGATAAQITEAHCRHNEAQHRFDEYVNVKMALKNQIIANVDIDYLEGAEDTYVGFANKSPRQLLDYLFQDYGRISLQQLDVHSQGMREAWNPSSPFSTFTKQIKTGMEYADAAKNPFQPKQIITIAETVIFNTGMFFEELKKWQAKPEDEKTWTAFQTYFRNAHRERLQQHQTTQGAGFHAANAAFCMETNDAIANLANNAVANSTTQDRIFQELTNQNQLLLQRLETLEKQQRGNGTAQRPNNSSAASRSATSRVQRMLLLPDNKKYCSTHGWRIVNHDSPECKNKGPNHNDTATRENPQGGSTKGKAERGL